MEESLEKLQLLIDKSSTGGNHWLHRKLKELKKSIITDFIKISNNK